MHISVIRQHGLVFTLIPDPFDSLWIEIRRESDGAVVVSAPFGGEYDEFADGVAEWIDDIMRKTIEAMTIDSCNACGARRMEYEIPEDLEEMTDHQVVEAKFLLCAPCAQHMVRTNPWVIKAYGYPAGYFS